MQRWNPKTHDYEPYAVPNNWNCPVLTYDMDEVMNCVSCGKQIRFGECYTSRFIHTESGMGYNVCADCHAKEYE